MNVPSLAMLIPLARFCADHIGPSRFAELWRHLRRHRRSYVSRKARDMLSLSGCIKYSKNVRSDVLM